MAEKIRKSEEGVDKLPFKHKETGEVRALSVTGGRSKLWEPSTWGELNRAIAKRAAEGVEDRKRIAKEITEKAENDLKAAKEAAAAVE